MPTISYLHHETFGIDVDTITEARHADLAAAGFFPVLIVHGDRAFWDMPNTAVKRSSTFHLNLPHAKNHQRLNVIDLIERAHFWAESEGLLATEELKEAGFVEHHKCSICGRPVGYGGRGMTFEELKEAGFVEHHKCSICGMPVGYVVDPEGFAAALMQTGCDCVVGSYPNYRLITLEELAAIPSLETEDEG